MKRVILYLLLITGLPAYSQYQWQVTIVDNGIGIEQKNQERVFGMFQRLHFRKDYEGSGIGLAFCKKIVELHKGTIWLTSVPGEGSTFHFTIKNV